MPRRSRTCCPIFSSSKKTKSTNDRGHRLADARLSPAPAGTSEHVPPEAKHGLFILVDKPQDQVDGVDFVALHGLNGHYRRTWSGPVLGSDEPYNWLEKDLPRAIPNARVMSYGYDSAVFSQSVADIGDFADQLLEQLLVIRSSQGERDRPLLFLCHSLGGIVFKKVLVLAAISGSIKHADSFTYVGINTCSGTGSIRRDPAKGSGGGILRHAPSRIWNS